MTSHDSTFAAVMRQIFTLHQPNETTVIPYKLAKKKSSLISVHQIDFYRVLGWACTHSCQLSIHCMRSRQHFSNLHI
jgi:hypothetical protein